MKNSKTKLKTKLKTFKDLSFQPKQFADGIIASITFDNGTYISVIGGSCAYGNGYTSFEIMSTVSERRSRGVDGWLSKTQVTRRMRYLQSLPQQ